MDFSDFKIEDGQPPANYPIYIYNKSFNSENFQFSLNERIFTIPYTTQGPLGNPLNIVFELQTRTVILGSPPSYSYYQGRHIQWDSSGEAIRKTTWATHGWDVSTRANHLAQITAYCKESIYRNSVTSLRRFGSDYMTQEYNLVYVQGKPLYNGIPYSDELIMFDIWMGSDPAADVIITPA